MALTEARVDLAEFEQLEAELAPAKISGDFEGKDILSTHQQMELADWELLLGQAADAKRICREKGRTDALGGLIVATMFDEMSSRTVNSFKAAAYRAGAGTIGYDNAGTTSQGKGESWEHTVWTFDALADVLVIRHPNADSLHIAAQAARKPVINAGNGTGEHPTQAHLDAFTVREKLGRLNELRWTFVGDLAHNRPVHSLLNVPQVYGGECNYVTPPGLGLPGACMDRLDRAGIQQRVASNLRDVIRQTDVLYVVRNRKEYMREDQYAAVQGSLMVTRQDLAGAPEHMVIGHPLPVDQADPDFEAALWQDPRMMVRDQMENGVYTRMALLGLVLGRPVSEV